MMSFFLLLKKKTPPPTKKLKIAQKNEVKITFFLYFKQKISCPLDKLH